jgi:hypothetical protein
MEFLVRLLLTILLAPVWVIIGFSPAVFWTGYDGPKAKAARKRKEAARRQADMDRRNWEIEGRREQEWRKREDEARKKDVAQWMAAHPVEAARIAQEQKRRLKVDEAARRAKLADDEEERRAKLAAEEEKRRKSQQALDAALAIPLSEGKATLLSEMPFPPSLADLQRFADER